MSRTVNVVVPIVIPDDIDLSEIDLADIVNQMLDVGYADACDTCSDPDFDCDDAEIITQLIFEEPFLQDA